MRNDRLTPNGRESSVRSSVTTVACNVDLIHIGYHRCASTTLHNDVFGAHPQIALARKVRTTACRNLVLDEVPVSEDYIPGDRMKVVISSEGFCEVNYKSANLRPTWGDRPEQLFRAWPHARILMMIRRQPDLIRSYYGLGLIKWNLTVLPRTYYRTFFRHEQLEFDEQLGRYIELFGKDRVLALPLEMLASDSDEFLSRLSNFIQIDLRGCPLRRLNTGGSDSANEAIRWANYIFRLFGARSRMAFMKKLFRAAASDILPSNEWFYAPGERESMRERYWASNRRTSQMIGIDLIGCYGY